MTLTERQDASETQLLADLGKKIASLRVRVVILTSAASAALALGVPAYIYSTHRYPSVALIGLFILVSVMGRLIFLIYRNSPEGFDEVVAVSYRAGKKDREHERKRDFFSNTFAGFFLLR